MDTALEEPSRLPDVAASLNESLGAGRGSDSRASRFHFRCARPSVPSQRAGGAGSRFLSDDNARSRKPAGASIACPPAGVQQAGAENAGWVNGFLWFVLVLIALICGYVAWMIFYDWLTRKEPLNPKDDTWWITPVVWILLLSASIFSVWLFRRLV